MTQDKAKQELQNGETSYNLLTSIDFYIEEFFKIYYSYEQRMTLTEVS